MGGDPETTDTGQEKWQEAKTKTKKRKHDEKVPDNYSESEEDDRHSTSDTRQTKPRKISPIVVNTKVTDISKVILNIKSLCKERVYFKTTNVNFIVYTNTEEDFNTVSTLFKKLEIQFYSYANKQDKKRHVVLKNLHCATPQDIIDELEKDHSVSVTKCVLMKRKQQSEQNGDNFTPTYFITLANPEKIGVIKRIKFLGSFKKIDDKRIQVHTTHNKKPSPIEATQYPPLRPRGLLQNFEPTTSHQMELDMLQINYAAAMAVTTVSTTDSNALNHGTAHNNCNTSSNSSLIKLERKERQIDGKNEETTESGDLEKIAEEGMRWRKEKAQEYMEVVYEEWREIKENREEIEWNDIKRIIKNAAKKTRMNIKIKNGKKKETQKKEWFNEKCKELRNEVWKNLKILIKKGNISEEKRNYNMAKKKLREEIKKKKDKKEWKEMNGNERMSEEVWKV
ncbi:hypothetical protein KQX54_015271 [Cotesia glomerata]|uniref:Pre-C2HC domain-containing protein n=1 Tax=Cotesia glomerata TaxID=32391 RepID=A0AAV7I9C3_COTGL|nr:hypothetical protein KQX54_015271 [Cotesia glomerata]